MRLRESATRDWEGLGFPDGGVVRPWSRLVSFAVLACTEGGGDVRQLSWRVEQGEGGSVMALLQTVLYRDGIRNGEGGMIYYM